MKESIFGDALKYLEDAIAYAKPHPATVERLRKPYRAIEVSVPVKMDNGSTKVFTGYRVQHSLVRGPAKGGIRYHPNVSMDELRALSFWMTFKTAAIGLPFGGGKGGIIVNPKELSEGELERLSRGYIRRIASFIGPDTDIPAPDVYTNAQIMGWMMDEYSNIVGRKTPAVITGKPIALGGSRGRETATGRGGYFCVKILEEKNDWAAHTKSVAIQGFGNSAQSIALSLFADGYKIVAVSDSKGAIYSKAGIDIPELVFWKNSGNTVSEFSEKEQVITNEELLTLDVEILVPAALESVITKVNASKVRAKNIIELANGPVTYEAHKALIKKGIFIVPDILANSGGVAVSHLEWVQNRQGLYWSEEDVNSKLRWTITEEFKEIYAYSQEAKIDMRTATYVHALKRLDEAMSYI